MACTAINKALFHEKKTPQTTKFNSNSSASPQCPLSWFLFKTNIFLEIFGLYRIYFILTSKSREGENTHQTSGIYFSLIV
jgi:hypothetical protein